VYSDSTATIVIGGGLAGLTSALLLQAEGKEVIVLEAKDYPRHKVCGEFISREILPLFNQLDLWPKDYTLPQITELRLSVASGKQLSLSLSHGAIGWSRYKMDEQLANTFKSRGGIILSNSPVVDLSRDNDSFKLRLRDDSELRSKLVLAAIGKRSLLDKSLNPNPPKRSRWMGWKMHFRLDGFPSTQVQLHNFPGGYAGLSQVEDGIVNMAALLDSRLIKGEGDSWNKVKRLLSQNPYLNSFLNSATEIIDRPIAVSQLDYSPRPQVTNGILLLGDSAGMIHPLSGNGMAMAIGSAQLAVKSALPFLEKEISRKQMEADYSRAWQQQYRQRLRVSRFLRAAFAASGKSEMALKIALGAPSLSRWLERQTHGKAPAL
jgi:flavin-dependent dehydrogenase